VSADGDRAAVWRISGDTSTATISEQFRSDAGAYHERYAASAHFLALFRHALAATGVEVAEAPVVLDLGSGSGVNSIVPCLEPFPGARQGAADPRLELPAIPPAELVANHPEARVRPSAKGVLRADEDPGGDANGHRTGIAAVSPLPYLREVHAQCGAVGGTLRALGHHRHAGGEPGPDGRGVFAADLVTARDIRRGHEDHGHRCGSLPEGLHLRPDAAHEEDESGEKGLGTHGGLRHQGWGSGTSLATPVSSAVPVD